MTKVLLLSTRLAWLVGLVLVCGPVAGGTIGYGHRSGQVYRLDLDSGTGDLSWQVESETELGGISGSLAGSADGRLFGTSSWWPNDDSLFVIEPSTGSFEFVGPIAGGMWADLTFDDQQRLWMVSGAELYLVDTSTAMTTPVPIDPADLLAIGFHAGRLFGIAGEGFESFRLVEIDPDLGVSHTLVEMHDFIQLPCSAEQPTGMAFDDAGGLWVVVAEWIGTCILPTVATSYLYLPNPLSGNLGTRRRLAPGAPIFMPSLEVVGGPVTVEIPTLSAAGLALLVVLVVIAGLSRIARLRRRRGWGDLGSG